MNEWIGRRLMAEATRDEVFRVTTDPVPVDSPLRWFGSKFTLGPKLLALVPPHNTWVDVFAGGGTMTLSKPRSSIEVMNDLDGLVVDFYRVLQDPVKADRLASMAEMTPYSRQWYENIRDSSGPWAEPPADDVERAYRFFVVNRMSFGGWSGDPSHRGSWSYSVSLHRGRQREEMAASTAVWRKGVESLMAVHDRIKSIQFECGDFRAILKRYDTPETAFYLDPPYIPETRVRGGYRHEMTADDHAEMVEMLLGLKGMALLSGYAHPLYEPLERAGWERREYQTRIFCSGKAAKKGHRTECVWINPAVARRLRQGSLLEMCEEE